MQAIRILFFIPVYTFFISLAGAQTVTPSPTPEGKWSLEIIFQAGMSAGGDYLVPTDLTTRSPAWTPLSKEFTFSNNGGVVLSYGLGTKTGISLGLLYSEQGQKYGSYTWEPPHVYGYPFSTSIYTPLVGNRTVSLNYLKMPLQFTYKLFPEKKISIIFSAGGYVGFLVSYIDKSSITNNEGTTFNGTAKGQVTTYPNMSAFISKPYKPVDFGVASGAGFLFKLSERIFLPFIFTYHLGLKNVKNGNSQIETGIVPYPYTGSPPDGTFWQISMFERNAENSPNPSTEYKNSLVGVQIGLKIKL